MSDAFTYDDTGAVRVHATVERDLRFELVKAALTGLLANPRCPTTYQDVATHAVNYAALTLAAFEGRDVDEVEPPL